MNIFDKSTNRINTDSVKWDERESIFASNDVIPLWVADMDFESPKEIVTAIKKRADHAIFGYSFANDRLFEAVIDFNYRFHDWKIEKKDIFFLTNVLSPVNILIRVLSKPKDKIIMFSPVYFPFFKTVEKLNRIVVNSNMKVIDNKYHIDFEDFERKIVENKPKVLIFCNPHNPGGRVWTKKELTKVIDICEKYQIEIISDDIHKDLVFPNNTYTPLAKLANTYKNHIYTVTAPTKTFNLAAIKIAYCIITDQKIKNGFLKIKDEINHPSVNIFGMVALESVYTECDYWLNELNQYLYNNFQLIKNGLKNTKFNVFDTEGTYLLWIDYQAFNIPPTKMRQILIDNKLGIQMGEQFGESGLGYFRMNIGTQKETIVKVVKILQQLDKEL